LSKQRSHDQLVQDMGRQVQLLLHERMQARAEAEGVQAAITAAQQGGGGVLALPPSSQGSSDIVVFRDIQELQQRNRELLAVTHRLQEEKRRLQEAAAGGGPGGPGGAGAIVPASIQEDLGKAHRELKRLAEDREAMAAAVKGLAQERDMVRLLLVKAEARLMDAGLGPAAGPGGVPLTAEAKSAASAGAAQAAARDRAKEVELEAKLRDVHDRLARMEELYREQVTAADQLRTELSAARQDASLSKADATFYQVCWMGKGRGFVAIRFV
jgi:DNA repair exonuclease SbcCD ATPase subunit